MIPIKIKCRNCGTTLDNTKFVEERQESCKCGKMSLDWHGHKIGGDFSLIDALDDKELQKEFIDLYLEYKKRDNELFKKTTDTLHEFYHNFEAIFHYLHMRGHESLSSKEEYEVNVQDEVLSLFLKGPKFHAFCEHLVTNPKECLCRSSKYLERGAHANNFLGEKIEKAGFKLKRERPM